MAAFDEQEYTKSFDWKIWKRLLPLLKPYRSAFAGMLLFNGICALIDVILPLFQRYAIGNFIEAGTLQAFFPTALAIWPSSFFRLYPLWRSAETPCALK